MNVACAKDHIAQINKICNEANTYYGEHMEEAYFIIDAVAFLCDYRRTLEKAIDKAELKL